jgi:hypothetical protein
MPRSPHPLAPDDAGQSDDIARDFVPSELVINGMDATMNGIIDSLHEWIAAAEAVRSTCQNKSQFDLLIDHQKRRVDKLQVEAPVGSPKSREVLIPTTQIGRHAANFVVGFGTITVQDRVERVKPAGSGTLVTVGSIYGILTAAHVLDKDNLPDNGTVALILSAEAPSQLRRTTIQMENTEKLRIGEAFGPNGPDLGFLRIFGPDITKLEALGVFYNIAKRANDVLADRVPAKNSVDAVVGVIAEGATDIEPDGRPTATVFQTIFCGGTAGAIKQIDDYDLIDFEPTNRPNQNFELPSSYKGASGGAVWRFYFEMQAQEPSVLESRLIGVPFYESWPSSDGNRVLTCHGPKSIYNNLIAAIKKNWPEKP